MNRFLADWLQFCFRKGLTSELTGPESYMSSDPYPLAQWVDINRVIEPRGALSEIDLTDLPFVPARIFTITACPEQSVRGEHAHHEGQQLLVCLRGRVDVELRHKVTRSVTCTDDGPGLLIPAPVWAKQCYATEDTTLLVVSSHPYDPSAYIDS